MVLRYPEPEPEEPKETASQKRLLQLAQPSGPRANQALALRPNQAPQTGQIIYPSRVQNGIVRIPQEAVESCSLEMMDAGARLPFNPRLTKTMLDLKKIEDLNLDDIRHHVAGLILSVNGTLIGQGSEIFEPAIVEKLRELRAKMKVCVFPNAGEEHTLFHELQIPIVKHAAPKPDPRGIERAAYNYLNLKPHQCASVGSNPIEEVAARRAGMRVILVDPLPGKESVFYKMGRGYGRLVKSVHDKLLRRKKAMIK